MRISIYGNSYQDAYAEALKALFGALAGSGMELSFEPQYRKYLERLLGTVYGREATAAATESADLVISIGGDGTFLHTANHVGQSGVPVMGLNAGHLGYLAAAPLTEVAELVADITGRNYIVEPRAMLAVDCRKHSISSRPFALNEVALLRQDTASMIAVDAWLDGEQLALYEGDGLIVATPTGSTAYSLSAGGPILAPTAPNWVITPVAPHSLTMRPLVVSDSTVIELTGRSRSASVALTLDGRATLLPTGASVEIRKADHALNVVRLKRHTFIDTLRQKLLWGAAGK